MMTVMVLFLILFINPLGRPGLPYFQSSHLYSNHFFGVLAVSSATKPPWIFFQEQEPHSIIKAEGLTMKHNITAQRGILNEITYNSSHKGVKEA
jgi:hypothetical protein